MTVARSLVFSWVACIVYVLAYQFGWQLFRYYPAVNEFHLAAQPAASGPSMMYYGWQATAALAGLAAALLVPRSWAQRLPVSLAWTVPACLGIYTLFYERHWFVA